MTYCELPRYNSGMVQLGQDRDGAAVMNWTMIAAVQVCCQCCVGLVCQQY